MTLFCPLILNYKLWNGSSSIPRQSPMYSHCYLMLQAAFHFSLPSLFLHICLLQHSSHGSLPTTSMWRQWRCSPATACIPLIPPVCSSCCMLALVYRDFEEMLQDVDFPEKGWTLPPLFFSPLSSWHLYTYASSGLLSLLFCSFIALVYLTLPSLLLFKKKSVSYCLYLVKLSDTCISEDCSVLHWTSLCFIDL